MSSLKVDKASEKYKNWIHFGIAYAYRAIIRLIVSSLLSWNKDNKNDEEGCTIIIGMCSKLPDVLLANLNCLEHARWDDLKEVIITIDNVKGALGPDFEINVQKKFSKLPIRFLYYSPYQYWIAKTLHLPYIFSWLSWSLAIDACRTKVFFIQDYDALVFGNCLAVRYASFVKSGKFMQGVFLYQSNGIKTIDNMVSSLQVFIDTAWIKSSAAIDIFNQVGILNGKRVDFDTLLYMESLHCPQEKREIVAVSEEDLIHPHQMIHQYTMCKKIPGHEWYCASLSMIPFFYYLAGQVDIFKETLVRMNASKIKSVDLLGDGCIMNFTWLKIEDLNRMLRLMVQAFVKLNIVPFVDFYNYANVFYEWSGASTDERWNFAETQEQQKWIEGFKSLSDE